MSVCVFSRRLHLYHTIFPYISVGNLHVLEVCANFIGCRVVLGVYIGAEHLVFAVGLFVQVESCFSVLFVMGYLTLLVTDVGYYGLRKMLDVLSCIMLRLGNRMVDRWLLDGDTVATPRIVVGAEGDTGVLPRSGTGSGVVVGGRSTACVHCLVDVESQVYGESSLVAD